MVLVKAYFGHPHNNKYLGFFQVIAVRKAYIFDHWNQFDLFIITLAAADLVIDHLFERSEHKVRAVRVFRLIRLARVLRLLKVSSVGKIDHGCCKIRKTR